ncbi:LysR family transcriptional regulator [Pectobacterium quasiaquaticum]|uniref:LysR family transcriptional regulator n=1 Tax=Pectobacterium quasiaquaticum TaxID=2774015 RepID=A0A9Q2EUI1_9GAMM|nr:MULTISPECIES: LysR family transcriptional regulator [Pectobacterium]MBE5202756.1 LysR family transcriptional regulator [Pectobacterium quasiaquaticum]MBE5210960.1 LysR family transcriptional regulator [Pectobacterium quasiaquaticum]MBE5212453.1 LysR family transcriptional regulator [Pectobacterium quasiaquaticum]MBE5222737.1 LysR family transcriptional regulator [Pectobacterium quasiaquaticum]MBE5225741.1 LysR family transcriptional regulator [Pectobacterium quasiaquaticum]
MPAPFTIDSLRAIVHFVTVADAHSFTEAADHLGMTRSAIGKSIVRLEERLGTKLFHRTTRKMTLTTEGEAYLASCRSALETMQAAESSLLARQTEPSGVVRIDMPAAFGKTVMMPVLLKIAAQYPEIRLVLTFNDRIIDPLDMGFDLAIRFGPLKDTTDLVARSLNAQHLLLCASPEYLSRYGTPLTLDDLDKHRCVMAWRGGSPLNWLVRDPQGQDIRFNPVPFHQISDGDAMIAAGVAGAGIIQFPESLLRPYFADARLIPVLPELTPSPTDLSVIWPRARALMPGVRFIVDELIRLADINAFA